MIPKTWKRWVSPARKPATTRFAPQFVSLETRDNPATFYVDPNAFLQPDGKYTFNNGLAGQQADLVLGTDIFFDFNSAHIASETTAGADTIRLAFGNIDVNNILGTLVFTEATDVVGSGSGATNLRPTNDSLTEFGPDAALFRVEGAAVNFSDMTWDGKAGDPVQSVALGQFVRYQAGATGTINRVNAQYVIFTGTGDSSGAVVVATGAGTVVNVNSSSFQDYGAIGVGYQLGATGKVTNSNFYGGGLGDFIVYGVQVINGSKDVLISGNTFTGHQASSGGSDSAAIFVTGYDPVNDVFNNASASIIGNSITGNVTGIILGTVDVALNFDPNVSAVIQHNNIVGNDYALVTDITGPTDGGGVFRANALYNWWGDVTGPFATGNVTPAGNNPGSAANEVDVDTLWRDPAIVPNGGVLQGKTPVIAATSAADYRSQLAPATVTVTAVTPSPTNAGTIKYDIVFSQPVFNFDLTDITITNPVGGTAALTGAGANYQLSITGAAGTGTITVAVPASNLDGAGLPDARTAQFAGTAASNSVNTQFDNTAPTVNFVISNQPITTSPATVLVNFSKPIDGTTFTASDIVLGGAGAGATVGAPTKLDAEGRNWSVVVSNLSTRGNVTLTMPVGSVNDLLGNASAAGAGNFNFIPPFSRGFAAGGDVGEPQPFFGVDENNSTKTGIVPFESNFTGGVRVASADLNGDGTLDILVASGVGRQAEVRLYDGKTTTKLASFQAFEAGFTLGAFVSAGDLNGDGVPDVVISPDKGGGARVTVLDGKAFATGTATQLANFFAFTDDVNFRGGVRTAVGNVNNAGRNELIVAAGFGGGPRVSVYNGDTVLSGANPPKLFGDFFAFSPADAGTLRNGVYVAAGDVNGDNFADIVFGSGDGGSGRVQGFSGKALTGGTFVNVANFFAGNVNNSATGTGGSRVAVKDIDGDGLLDIVSSPARTGGTKIGVFLGSNAGLTGGAVLAPNSQIDLFGSFVDGAFVG